MSENKDVDELFERIEKIDKRILDNPNLAFMIALLKLVDTLIKTSDWNRKELKRYSIMSKDKYVKAFFDVYIDNKRDLDRTKETVIKETIIELSKNINFIEKEKSSNLLDLLEGFKRK